MSLLRFACLTILISIASTAYTQTNNGKLKVFIDCKSVQCDNNFIRTEITLVDFVLDRIAADVHVLITSVKSGNGGTSIQYIFFGKDILQRYGDTLSGFVNPNTTNVELRNEILIKIKRGLLPFIAHSVLSDYIGIELKSDKIPTTSAGASASKDKWNYWVYNVGTDGNYNAEQVYKNTQLYAHLTANRTTPKLKLNFSSYAGYNSSTYTYEEDNREQENKVINSNYSFHHNLVKSISRRWSAGYNIDYSNNTFSNNKSSLHIRNAFEYAIFPYEEVNNKFFTLNYGIEVRRNQYYDTTIYNKISEVLWGHRAQAYLSIKQKWGNINSTITYTNFFKDWSMYHLSASCNVNIRITGGLSFYVFTRGGLIHDQVYLVKGKASEQDILVRRRQIASAYNFHSGVGLNFRFGSILNNFVNPRFDHP